MNQRLAAGEQNSGHAELGEVINRRAELRHRKLAGIMVRCGVRVAVGAAEVAAARDIPDDDWLPLGRRARRGMADPVAERVGWLRDITEEASQVNHRM